MKSLKNKNDERSTNPPLSTSPCPPSWDNGGSLSPKIPDWGFEVLQQSKRTLVATRTDKKSLSHLSPFFVEKVIQQFGEVNEIVRCRNGSILIEAKNTTQAEKLQNSKVTVGDCEINVALSTTAHNTCKAIIRDEDMVHWDQQELLEGLADQGVIAIHNVKSRPGSCSDKWTVTPTFIITFNRPTPPRHLKIGWLSIPTKEYVPEPIRCFQCQRYNHFRASCKNTAVCSRCAEPEHRPGPCNQGYKCINCGGSHSAAWKGCPVYKEEREVRKVGYRLKIPLSTAKKIYKSYVKKMASIVEPALKTGSQQSSENPGKETQEGCQKCLCNCISVAKTREESHGRFTEAPGKTTKAPEVSEEEEPAPDDTQKPKETVASPIQQNTPNTCNAIVEEESLYYSLETDRKEMLELLADQGVVAVDRIERSTSKLIYTFNRPTPPPFIYFGQIRIPTERYVPDTPTPVERKSNTHCSKNRKRKDRRGNSKIS